MPMHFFFSLPIFPVQVFFSVNESDDEFEAALKAWLPPGYSMQGLLDLNDVDGYGGCSEDGYALVRLMPGIKPDLFHGIVAHEILHVTVAILGHCGVTFDRASSEEVYAYLIGYLTNHFYTHWDEVK